MKRILKEASDLGRGNPFDVAAQFTTAVGQVNFFLTKLSFNINNNIPEFPEC